MDFMIDYPDEHTRFQMLAYINLFKSPPGFMDTSTFCKVSRFSSPTCTSTVADLEIRKRGSALCAPTNFWVAMPTSGHVNAFMAHAIIVIAIE